MSRNFDLINEPISCERDVARTFKAKLHSTLFVSYCVSLHSQRKCTVAKIWAGKWDKCKNVIDKTKCPSYFQDSTHAKFVRKNFRK